MLQKLLALLLSLILAATGGMPTEIFPSEEESGGEGVTVQTRPGPDDEANPLNVVWTKVDGSPVEDDRWGVGTVDRLAFKVGYHASADASVGIAGQEVEVGATDVLVVENFEGRFEFEKVGTPKESLLLDGEVQRTSVAGSDGSRVTTETVDEGGVIPSQSPASSNASRVQRVVIANEPLDGVSIARGEADRLSTEGPGTPEPEDIRAAWVRIDGEMVQTYRSGQGSLDNVTFQVGAYGGDDAPRLNVSGEPTPLESGARVRILDFEGSFRVYQGNDGNHRLMLNGVAREAQAPGTQAEVLDGQEPVARFEYVPAHPSTSDTITFTDASYDPDGGRILARSWDFGDGETSIRPNPRHSYDSPGSYLVSLEVTDDDLRTNVTTAIVDVANTPPEAAFEWHPEKPTDVEPVQFVSNAEDSDGEVTEHAWDFGDGETATGPRPEHTFPDDGSYEVTLSATDDSGNTSEVTRVVSVRNVPPDPDFSWNPQEPLALEPVDFTSQAEDPDGSVENLTWTFGDGGTAYGETAVHHFDDDGTYEVTLAATDDDGDTSEVTRDVTVENRPPEVGFDVLTSDPVTGEDVQFSEDAVDRDGRVSGYTWDFGDGNKSSAPEPTHAFGASGTYRVTLTVTDEEGATNSTSSFVEVANAPPVVDFVWTPEQPYDDTTVSFTDLTVDPDGNDELVSWFWTFGDGNASTDQNPANDFPDDGLYNVTLHVEDAADHNASLTQEVLVRNRPPTIDDVTTRPFQPNSRDTITMSMEASDADGQVVTHEWELPNGTVLEGRVVNTTFPEGDHTVLARAVDDDGAPAVQAETISVDPAPPLANFTTDPEAPAAGQETEFIDTSEPGDAPLDEWFWNFDDGSGGQGEVVTHTFDDPGTYEVSLIVEDENGLRGSIEKTVSVTAPPAIDFDWEPRPTSSGATTYFNATGSDPDGAIVNWTWSFEDDPDPVYGQNVTHVFPDSGFYDVQLTATDDRGATTSLVQTVTVENRPPEADFSHSPTYPMVNADVNFTDESQDPDGQVVTTIWTFGDGNQAVGENVTHRYNRSAIYDASVKAVDDEGRSGSHTEPVRVVNDHEVTLDVEVQYPNGQAVDLADGPFTTSFTVDATGLTAGPNGTKTVEETVDGHSRTTFAAGEWAGGEPITWRIDGPYIEGRSLTIKPPADAFLVERGPVQIVVPAESTLTIDPGSRGIDVRGDDTSFARYTDPTEPVTGNLTLEWVTGTPVKDASGTIEVRYDDVRRDVAYAPLVPVAAIDVVTDDGGRAAFTVPPTFAEDRGLYLPGWYEVQFTKRFDADLQSVVTGALTHFVEDPAGLLGSHADDAEFLPHVEDLDPRDR